MSGAILRDAKQIVQAGLKYGWLARAKPGAQANAVDPVRNIKAEFRKLGGLTAMKGQKEFMQRAAGKAATDTSL